MLVLTAAEVNRFYIEPLHELWFPEDGKSSVGAAMVLRRFKDISDFTTRVHKPREGKLMH